MPGQPSLVASDVSVVSFLEESSMQTFHEGIAWDVGILLPV